MSTRIEDLPGSTPEEFHPEDQQLRMNVRRKTHTLEEMTDLKTDKGIISSLRDEINEENVLLFIVLVVAAMPTLNQYMSQLPFLGNFVSLPSFSSILVKAGILLAGYILVKLLVLPKINL